MKTAKLYLATLLLSVFFVLPGIPTAAQKAQDHIKISGIVKDAETNKPLANVSVYVPDTKVGNISNLDGVFSIKVQDSLQATTIALSHLGYSTKQIKIGKQDMDNIEVTLSPTEYLLTGAYSGANALNIIKKAIRKIDDNYSQHTNLLTGFYREVVTKNNHCINVTEGILYTYKTPYSKGDNRDKVQVYKGRQLISPKPEDTLTVKLQGGPNAPIYMDIIKGWELLRGEKILSDYQIEIDGMTTLDERPHFVISFTPHDPETMAKYALYDVERETKYAPFYGKIYIDEETQAVSKIDVYLSMSSKGKATNTILMKKPSDLRFKPEKLAYSVTYKIKDGVSYLSYVRSELKFKSKWKRKSPNSTYEVISEMVVTDIKEGEVDKIPGKLAFGDRQIFSDKVKDFYDKNFWESYNIIEPTESLELAINKLLKQYE